MANPIIICDLYLPRQKILAKHVRTFTQYFATFFSPEFPRVQIILNLGIHGAYFGL
jgi:hypothetical protein